MHNNTLNIPQQKSLFNFIETSGDHQNGEQVEGFIVENHDSLQSGNHKKTVAAVVFTNIHDARSYRSKQIEHGHIPPMPMPVIITIHKPIKH